jgi:hypothetical protein
MQESKKNKTKQKKPEMSHSANLFPVIAMLHQPSLHFASQTNEGKHLFFFFFFFFFVVLRMAPPHPGRMAA